MSTLPASDVWYVTRLPEDRDIVYSSSFKPDGQAKRVGYRGYAHVMLIRIKLSNAFVGPFSYTILNLNKEYNRDSNCVVMSFYLSPGKYNFWEINKKLIFLFL